MAVILAVLMAGLATAPDPFAWEHRLILLDGPMPAWPEAALIERDILVIEIGERVAIVSPAKQRRPVTGAAAARVRDQLGDAAYALIGKDGGIKGKGPLPAWDEIAAQIDGMPMRQREMRETSR